MKKLFILIIAVMLAANLCAQTVTPENKKLIDTFVKNNVVAAAEDVGTEALSKVFTGRFFRIEVGFIETGSGASPCGSSSYVNIDQSTVKMAETIHTDIECPVLTSMIRKDFLLADENAARLFESCLNTIYPVSDLELPNVRHMKKDAQWIFIRDKFFDDYTAFIVTTGPNGAVTGIEVKLSYPVNQ